MRSVKAFTSPALIFTQVYSTRIQSAKVLLNCINPVYLPVSNLSLLMLLQVLASCSSRGKLTLAHKLRPYL